MCTVCGCGQGEMRINGESKQDDHQHGHNAAHNPAVHSPELDDIRNRHDDVVAKHDVHAVDHSHDHHHHYANSPAHAHAPGLNQSRMLKIEQDILAKNNEFAAANRTLFAARDIFTLNLVSSPGAGKTELLARTLRDLNNEFAMAVIEGDQETSNDAERIRATGTPAIQINTGKGCHLDAHTVGHASQSLSLDHGSLLFIENVGNLVCPAGFDLGEAHKVVILSVTEGEDKPIKYPDMFYAADVMLINKTDLLPYLQFDMQRCIEYALRVNKTIEVFPLSATSGEGLQDWYQWIRDHRSVQVSDKTTVDHAQQQIAGEEVR